MQTSTGQRLPGLDHLRTLAILLVFLFHYQMPFFGHPDWLPDMIKFGWTGVDLFFVLSGFLIASQLFAAIVHEKMISFKTFFIKRFFRIVPAYLVMVAVYFGFPYVHEREALAPLWKYLSFTQNLGLDLRTQGTFSHAWSLCIEEHFYLLLPLVLIVLHAAGKLRSGPVLILLLLVLTFSLRYVIYKDVIVPAQSHGEPAGIIWYKHIYYPSYCRLDGLLIGVSIAAISQFKPGWLSRLFGYGNWLLLLSLLVLAAAYVICLDQMSFQASTFGFLLVSAGYGLMLIAAIDPSGLLHKWNSRITFHIAALSYSVYLAHKAVIHVTQALLQTTAIDPDSNLMLLICLISSLLISLAMNRLVEKPFMKLRKRLVGNE